MALNTLLGSLALDLPQGPVERLQELDFRHITTVLRHPCLGISAVIHDCLLCEKVSAAKHHMALDVNQVNGAWSAALSECPEISRVLCRSVDSLNAGKSEPLGAGHGSKSQRVRDVRRDAAQRTWPLLRRHRTARLIGVTFSKPPAATSSRGAFSVSDSQRLRSKPSRFL